MLQSCNEHISKSISQKNMTTTHQIEQPQECPTEDVMRLLSSKFTLHILFRVAVDANVRFSEFLRKIRGANKQTLSVALRDLVDEGYLIKTTVQLKPLHIEYSLSEKGQQLVPLLKQFEAFRVDK